MKTTRSILVLAVLALLIILLSVPVLAKGIAKLSGDAMQSEKLDIKPVPVPTPPMAVNEPSISATPAPALSVISPMPQAIPVPTAPVSATQTASSFEPVSPSGSATVLMIPLVNREGFIVIALTFLVLLISVWIYRIPSFRSLNRKHA
jgi:hypothetical protein